MKKYFVAFCIGSENFKIFNVINVYGSAIIKYFVTLIMDNVGVASVIYDFTHRLKIKLALDGGDLKITSKLTRN